MKKNLLTLAAALLVATSAWAQNSFTVNGLNYQETGVGTGKVKITGYTTRPTGVLDIPETVSPSSGGSYTVTEIADEVFSECSDLTELVFPESLRTIGAHAFHYCQDLTSITCYNTTPPNVGESAFEGADKTIPVYVPANALSSYRSNAGWNKFTHITYITFISNNLEYKLLYTSPNQAEIIGYTTTPTGVLDIPATVNHKGKDYTIITIAEEVFSECSGLTELVFPESLRTIGAHAFHYCQDLTSITCYNTTPPNVGEGAFEGADKTIPVYVPANALSSYQSNADWSEFTHITYITFISNNLEYKLLYTSPNQAEIIGYTTTPTGVLDIPATVNHKGKDYTVITIAEEVFSECSGLTELVFPESLRTIGAHAFHYCQDLTSITCYNTTPPNVGEGAFEGADKTIPVYVPAASLAAYQAAEVWKEFNLQAIMVNEFTVGGLTYKVTDAATHTVELTGYETAPTGALTIPATVTNNGINYNVTSIGADAIWGIDDLTEVSIPNSITTIGENVFWACYYMTKVTIGSGVTSIGAGAFALCEGLTEMTVLATMPPTLGDDAFGGVDRDIPVYVPAASLAAYKAAEGWKEFTNLQAITTAIHTPSMPESISMKGGMLHNPQGLHLSLYDMQGRQVYSGTDATVSQPAGVYVLRCNGASGKVLF